MVQGKDNEMIDKISKEVDKLPLSDEDKKKVKHLISYAQCYTIMETLDDSGVSTVDDDEWFEKCKVDFYNEFPEE